MQTFLRCKVTRFCAPFPRYKKITKNDQIITSARCIRACPNKHLTFFSFKVFKNARDFDFNFERIVWTEVNMTDNYFSGKN